MHTVSEGDGPVRRIQPSEVEAARPAADVNGERASRRSCPDPTPSVDGYAADHVARPRRSELRARAKGGSDLESIFLALTAEAAQEQGAPVDLVGALPGKKQG